MAKKPEHFYDKKKYPDDQESAEHDKTLRKYSVKSIGMEQLGNPFWDPITFSSAEGKIYYMPALIRLCLETIDSDNPYLCQYLSHLELDGNKNDIFIGCNSKQWKFISSFINFLIEHYYKVIENEGLEDEIIRASEIWGKA